MFSIYGFPYIFIETPPVPLRRQDARPSSDGLCFFYGVCVNTYVYIDGFNLYFGAVRGTPYKWLDLSKMCRLLLPKHTIAQIRYYTALVRPRAHDPQQLTRQQTFLRALHTLPNLSIHLGTFLSHEVDMPLANSSSSPPSTVKVIKTEEKGSDVNLATHLLQDGFAGKYDCAIVVSNDSDLVEPIKVVRNDLRKVVGVLNPHKRQSRELQQNAKFVKRIRAGVLKACQFPSDLKDSHGSFHKPARW